MSACFEDSINVLKLEVRLRDNALDVYKLNLEKDEAERDQRECCAPINEELVLDGKKKTVVPTIPKVDVVRPKQQEKPVRKTVKYAEMYRSQKPRGNQRNWNNQKSQQLGNDFVMHNKTCYVCGSFDHLQYTCKQKRQLNGQREEKPVWNNARRGNPETKLEDLVRLNSPKDEKRAGAELTQQNDKVIVTGELVSHQLASAMLVLKVLLLYSRSLMLAIPDEHLLKFHACKDAKSLWEAIKNSQEGLDKTYDRFQKLISQLKIHGEVITQEDTADLLNTGIFNGAYDDEDVGAEADLNNLETTINVSPIPTTRIHRDHPKEQIIGDPFSAPQTRRMTKSAQEHAMVNYIKNQRRTNHKDYQNCLFACFLSQIEPKKVTQALTDLSWIEAMQDELLQFRLQMIPGIEALSTYLLENGFRRGAIDKTLFIKKDKYDAQEIPDEFYGGARFLFKVAGKAKRGWNLHQPRQYVADILKKFDYVTVKCQQKFQVTPKVSHLHAMKRIFRYLKGQPKLGLWYHRDSPFDMEAFSDSDYAGASLDKKSTT
ncbi:hypothetical protein Tco_0367445 [Tanacetum coccineum]